MRSFTLPCAGAAGVSPTAPAERGLFIALYRAFTRLAFILPFAVNQAGSVLCTAAMASLREFLWAGPSGTSPSSAVNSSGHCECPKVLFQALAATSVVQPVANSLTLAVTAVTSSAIGLPSGRPLGEKALALLPTHSPFRNTERLVGAQARRCQSIRVRFLVAARSDWNWSRPHCWWCLAVRRRRIAERAPPATSSRNHRPDVCSRTAARLTWITAALDGRHGAARCRMRPRRCLQLSSRAWSGGRTTTPPWWRPSTLQGSPVRPSPPLFRASALTLPGGLCPAHPPGRRPPARALERSRRQHGTDAEASAGPVLVARVHRGLPRHLAPAGEWPICDACKG